MRQPLRSLTRWVVAGVLAGVETGAIACCEPPVEEVGFLDANGIVTEFAAPGATQTIPDGINNAGQIVGSAHIDAPYGTQGFLYTGGTFSTIFWGRSTFATDINNSGQIVGYGVFGPLVPNGFLKVGDTFSQIGVPGALDTFPAGINDAGQIVGTFRDFKDAHEHGFLYAAGAFTTIDVPGSFGTQANGINNFGQIVGSFSDSAGTHGFLYAGGTFSTIDVPGSTHTSLVDINNTGQIVGNSDLAALHNFLYAGGTFSAIDVPGELRGINDAGHIVGVLSVPEPSSLVLFSVGLLALGLTWRRRCEAP